MPTYSLMAVAALTISLPLFGAQSTAPVAVSAPPSTQQLIQAITTAKAQFETGDIAGGETTLFAANLHAAGTPEWNRDSGAALIGMACAVHQDGDSATSTKLATEALTQLKLAQASAGSDSKLAANVYALIGFVQERFSGTRQQAEASYSTAVSLSAASVPTAAAALKRMQAEDVFLALRGTKPAGN